MATQCPPTTVFHRSLNRFKIGLSDQEKEDFELTSLDEVHTVVLEIQKEHASERKMQNMVRIQCFLEGMEQYGNVIEVFLNVSMFVAFVWGPVKFLLQVAKTWTESLDLLLDAYEQIGETIPQLIQYDKLFTQNPAMQRVLGLIYQDILEFHRRALVVFKRKSWKQLFRSTWKIFNTHFNRLVQNLQRHKLDIERQASLIEIERNQVQREAQEKQFFDAEKLEREKQAISVIEKISPANSDLDQENISKHWTKEPQFGLWLLKNTKMEAWLDSENLDAKVLWLKGIPGAGKSVLVSRLIAETRPSKPIIFFYCKYEDRNRNSLRAVLKAFLVQLIRFNLEIVSHVYGEVSASSELTLETLEYLKKLVGYALEGSDPLWIVIDGLDECEKKEKKKILSWLMDILEAEESPGRVRLLVASQDDGDIRKFLAKKPSMSLNNAPQHQEAIRTYASRKSAKIKCKLDIPTSIERNIVELVTDRSNGMFLFARLVLKHLKSQVTLIQLEQELNPFQFPTELYDIYDRVIHKIHSNGAQQRLAADRILAWIVRCKRPLQWHEVQSMFAIDIHKRIVDFPGRRLRGVDIKDLCGPLVEMSSSGAIELVHHTAKSYLLDQSRSMMEPRVSIHVTDMEIATTCLQYLCFRCFEGNLTDEEISNYAWQGYYSFQEFAIVYWLEHLQASFGVEISNDSDTLKRLSLLIDNFMDMHLRCQEGFSKTMNAISTTSRSGQLDRALNQIKVLQIAWKSLVTNENTSIKQGISHFREQLNRRRSIFEKIIVELPSESPKRVELSTYYGDPGGWFKCFKIKCFAFHEGFPSLAMREAHEKKHQRAFRCPLAACHYSVIGFSSASELTRHHSKSHLDLIEEKDATFPKLIAADLEQATALAHSQLNGKRPSADSVYYHDENEIKANESIERTLGNIVGHSNTSRLGRDDIAAWPRSLGIMDDWVAFFHPISNPTIEIDLNYTFQHSSPVACVVFSKDGKYLATGCNNSCQLFDAVSGELLSILKPENVISGNDNFCRSICFSLDGTFLLNSWEEPYAIQRWSIDQKGSCALTKGLVGHEGEVYSIEISKDGSIIASSGADQTVRLWDYYSGGSLHTFRTEHILACVSISPDSRFVVAASDDNCAYVWEIATGEHIATLKGHTDSVYSVSVMKECPWVVTTGLDNAVIIWDLSNISRWNEKNHGPFQGPVEIIGPLKILLGHSDFGLCATTTFDDRWILSGSKDCCIRVWDQTGNRCTILKGHSNSIIRIAADPTGRAFATASGDMKMRLWRYKEIEKAAVTRARRSDLHSLLT